MQNYIIQYQDEVLSCMNFLHQQISEIENYPEKSLFFQNPLILEGWLALVKAIEKIDAFYVQEREKTTETYYVLYLLSMRDLRIKFKNLSDDYYYKMKGFSEFYGGWLTGECISTKGIEALSADQYGQYLEDVGNINQYLAELNRRSLRARSDVYSVFSDISHILQAVMNRGIKIIKERFPYIDDFVKAINEDLRLYTKDFGEDMLRDMKEDLNRHYKVRRTDPETPTLWGEMLSAYEQALEMAIDKELAKCDAPKQKHWDAHQPKDFMDENGEMISRIYELCYTDKLIDLNNPDNIQSFLPVLTADNIELFYNLIVTRNLIQCEMDSEIKKKHDAWLREEIKSKEEVYMKVVVPKEDKDSTKEARIREALEKLMQESITIQKRGKNTEESLFRQQNHWQAVYRILVDKNFCMDSDFEGFDSYIQRVIPEKVNAPYKMESVKHISQTDFNRPFERWEYNGETSGKRKIFERMQNIAQRFKQILEEKGL